MIPLWALVLISFIYGANFGNGVSRAIREGSWMDFSFAMLWAFLAFALAMSGGKW